MAAFFTENVKKKRIFHKKMLWRKNLKKRSEVFHQNRPFFPIKNQIFNIKDSIQTETETETSTKQVRC